MYTRSGKICSGIGRWGVMGAHEETEQTRCIFDLLCPSLFTFLVLIQVQPPDAGLRKTQPAQVRFRPEQDGFKCVYFLFSPCGETSTELTNIIHIHSLAGT